MPTSYPVKQLIALDGKLTITPTSGVRPPATESIEQDGWLIDYGPTPDKTASLVYCPDPDEGLANVQAREQTSYDLWLSFEGDKPPKLYLGAETTPQILKQSGQQAYLALNWGNYVGTSSIRLVENGVVHCELSVEVRAHKLDYLSEYRDLLDDISTHVTTLIFDYAASTAVFYGQTSHHFSVAYLDYLFLRYLLAPHRLPRHFQVVTKAPHRVTRREDTWIDVSQVRRVTPQAITALLAQPEYLAHTTGTRLQPIVPNFVSTRLLDDRVIATFDTPPNRFVKHFLAQLIHRLRQLTVIFATHQADHLVIDCHNWRRTLEIFRRAHFLEEVGSMHVYPGGSQVLLKQEGYRQLNDYYRRFLLTGRVAWEGFVNLIRTPTKDLATLYEYWCYFELLKALTDVLKQPIKSQDILRFNETPPYEFRISLSQAGQNRVSIGNTLLHYNRYYNHGKDGSYSVMLHPDYTLETKTGMLVFDAKYRLNDLSRWTQPSRQTEKEEDETLIYQKGDLYKMHTYRDALKARAVFILYPGRQFSAYATTGEVITHPANLPPDFAGVGTIPVKPQQTDSLQHCLTQLLGF